MIELDCLTAALVTKFQDGALSWFGLHLVAPSSRNVEFGANSRRLRQDMQQLRRYSLYLGDKRGRRAEPRGSRLMGSRGEPRDELRVRGPGMESLKDPVHVPVMPALQVAIYPQAAAG